jgi:hypothetical protein
MPNFHKERGISLGIDSQGIDSRLLAEKLTNVLREKRATVWQTSRLAALTPGLR